MTARHLVVGLDGADLSLLRRLGPRRTPHLHALMAEGCYAAQRSVLPVSTLPNWTSFLTALDPAGHGVLDFTLRAGYRVRFLGASVRLAGSWVAALDALGMQCAMLGFPGTWPPEPLRHGVVLSGWDAPIGERDLSSRCWPRSLGATLRERFGPEVLGSGEVDEFRAERPGWHAALGQRLRARIERRAELYGWLLEQRAWDVFLVYFGEGDTAAHHLWAHFDLASPRRPARVAPAAAEGLAEVWQALDAAVGRLLQAAGGAERVRLTVLGDHGSGGASDRVLHLNALLADLGLLSWRKGHAAARLAAAVRREVPARLPARLREAAFRLGGGRGADALETATRFGGIDWPRTVAFSEELNYAPAIWLNVRGREPQGRIAPWEVARWRRRLAEALLAVRDPWDGEPLVRAVHEREALYEPGPGLGRAPDLLLELRHPGGYSYNLLPSSEAGAACGPFRRLASHERTGRKGRALAGSHRLEGFALLAGPDIAARGEHRWDILQTAATTLQRIGVAPPPQAAARPLWEALRREASRPRPARPLPTASAPPKAPKTDAQPGALARRLRALGYVD